MRWGIVDETMRCIAFVESPTRPQNAYPVPDGVTVKVGYLWGGWEWQAPRWTALEFLKRFTWQERASIRIASVDDEAVADFVQLSQAAQEVVADDPVTVAGMDYLVSLNLLTPARRAEILS
jgi:hypothetical protein